MAKSKKVADYIKLQIPAGQANPSPPVGPALGQRGVNIMDFCKAFNEQTKGQEGPIPVVITVYADRSFTFETKAPPASYFILKAVKKKKGSGEAGKKVIASISMKQLREIAEQKMKDLNANDIDAAARMLKGTALSMGIEVVGNNMAEAKKYKHKGNHTNKPGKRLRKSYEVKGINEEQTLEDAVAIIKQLADKDAPVKFDQTCDIVINLNVDPKHSDQMVRGSTDMPNGLGKDVKVAVFAKGEKQDEAKKAGAEIVGDEEYIASLMSGSAPVDFDRCIATPDMMAQVGKLGKVLGPKGLMPNPKLGTVTNDVADAVKAAKSGQVEFRVEKAGIIHAGVGKLSFTAKALAENIKALVTAVVKAKPSGAKGTYIKSIAVGSTMGPSVPLNINSVLAAE